MYMRCDAMFARQDILYRRLAKKYGVEFVEYPERELPNISAEQILADACYDIYVYGCDLDCLIGACNDTAGDVLDLMMRAMVDNSDDYDADWFPLIATKSIRDKIRWDIVADLYTAKCVDDYVEVMFDE